MNEKVILDTLEKLLDAKNGLLSERGVGNLSILKKIYLKKLVSVKPKCRYKKSSGRLNVIHGCISIICAG